VSDITKKIFSIESEGPALTPEPSASDIIRPVVVNDDTPHPKPVKEDVPEFVTREAKTPLSAPPQLSLDTEAESRTSAAGWVILGLGVLYLIGAGLYFGVPVVTKTSGLYTIGGLILLLALPVVMLFLLWRALRHLSRLSGQNARLSRAAEILVSPNSEAHERTKTLAAGIQSEIAKVNISLAETVESLKGVQLSVSRETQSLDAAGLQLTSRSDDVGRNLTLQRQALESISGTFDTRMGTLSNQITETSETLDSICSTAEEKLLKASESLQLASGKMDQTISESANRISEKITEIGEVSRKLDETSTTLTAGLETSTQTLNETDQGLTDRALSLQELNTDTQTKIIDLQNTIDQGNQMLSKLQEAAKIRDSFVKSYYQDLSAGLKQSENETLAAQGKTARIVESNLAQMRLDFASMETDLQALQTKLDGLKTATIPTASIAPERQQPRLKLEPLDSDFPPVEPPRFTPSLRPSSRIDEPMNLGADMEIVTPESQADAEIVGFEPDVIRRPGDTASSPKTSSSSKSKGFGRRAETEEKTGWRWRDMLGTLDRPDGNVNPTTAATGIGAAAGASIAAASTLGQPEKVNAVELLTMLQLSPSAIVDEGTVIDATQARINTGEIGLVAIVSNKLPEAIAHLKDKILNNPQLATNLKRYCDEFGQMIGNTSPTAPALRAALGSPDGRAYLLAVTALKG